jgi:hypothetical protein
LGSSRSAILADYAVEAFWIFEPSQQHAKQEVGLWAQAAQRDATSSRTQPGYHASEVIAGEKAMFKHSFAACALAVSRLL